MINNLYRLIYTSSRRPKCDDNEIQNILSSCKKNNPGKNITGVLLHSEKRFIQYLEGDKNEIMNLFEHIKKDDRHGGVNLRDHSSIEERIFPSWHMGYKDVNTHDANFDTRISMSDRKVFQDLLNDRESANEKGIRILKLFFEMA